MKQATLNNTILEPSLTEIKHITFTGDLTDINKTIVTVSLIVKDETGEKVQDLGITVSDIPNLDAILTRFQTNILPQIVKQVETDLEITFI